MRRDCELYRWALFPMGMDLAMLMNWDVYSMIPTYAYCGPMQMSTDEALRKVYIRSYQDFKIT